MTQQPYRPPNQPYRPSTQPYAQQPQAQPQYAQQPHAQQAPANPAHLAQTYGVAKPLEHSFTLSKAPQPSGALVALGVFLLVLSVVVPGLLALLVTLRYADASDLPVAWAALAPLATAVLTFTFAARAIANGGNRRRPFRALVHLALGTATLVLAVSLITDATGIVFFSW